MHIPTYLPILLLLLLLSMTNLVQGQTTPIVREVQYDVYTRGYTQTIHIRKDSIAVEEQGRKGNTSTREALSPTQWNSLLKSLDNVALTDISHLPSPTNRRQSDGAMHAKLIITTKDNTYTSKEFDANTPPKALDPLMQLIIKLSKKE